MSKKIGGIYLFMLLLALSLGACGGGATNDDIRRQQAECASGVAASCDLLNHTASTGQQTAAATPLFTTAPSAITLAFGGSATYAIGGGKAPYTATSSNTNVETIALSGTALTISSVASGTAQVAIVDSAGKSVTINVTVLGKGQTGTPPSIFPASITAGNCTTNIPFVFTGGTAPFTILSGDIFHVPVSAALRFGSDSYFMASLVDVETPKDVVVTVLDGQSRTATAIITIPTAGTCPKNELLHIVSGSQNAHITERITFQIAGSKPPYSTAATSFRSYDANNQLIVNPTTTGSPTVATDIVAVDSVVVDNGDGTYSFNVTAKSTGDPLALNGTVLITVTGEDKQQAHIVFTVFPPPLQP